MFRFNYDYFLKVRFWMSFNFSKRFGNGFFNGLRRFGRFSELKYGFLIEVYLYAE